MGQVAVLFALVATGLAAFGLGLLGLGAVLVAQGSVAGGSIAAGCGALIAYGSYLFGRAAVRTRAAVRAQTLTATEVRIRRRNVWHVLGYALVVIVSDLALPFPTAVRVIGVVTILLAVPLILAVDFEPPKKE